MIEVKSYIKSKEDYINILEFSGEIKDCNYIEGALELTINNVNLINLEMWDYIDQLWAYLSEGLDAISKNNEFNTYFPDQPIEVKLKPINDNVLISVKCNSKVTTLTNKNEFVSAMSKHALDFFERLSTIKGIEKDHYKYEIENLRKIHNK
ncbi:MULTISPECIES: hypothetical protein [Serratia]|uniref:hypothetical protein n=1 Tax=Serratia TaxID=613 RepID=UPI000CF5E693|nr:MULTISPECIES: hypothetical protein [Serratia]AVJ18249.1 hypothetical protein CLM71_14425 [Serratia sp. MYb239]MEB6336573.1 hypothetical protein [Serratia rhizosphaerae]